VKFAGGAFSSFGETKEDDVSDDEYPPEWVYSQMLHERERENDRAVVDTPERATHTAGPVIRRVSPAVPSPESLLQLDEILTQKATESHVVDGDTVNDSIETFRDRIEQLKSDAIARFDESVKNESPEVISEAKRLFEAHLRRNAQSASFAIDALVRMRSWEKMETERIRTHLTLQRARLATKNGIEDGFDPTRTHRMQVYRCICTFVGPVDKSDAPTCSTVFPGKYLTTDGDARMHIDRFSELTLGICPSCLEHYRIRDVNTDELVELARANVRTRERTQNWSEPVVRPATGAKEIHFSSDLESKLAAHRKKHRKSVERLIESLLRQLDSCVERLSNPSSTADSLQVVMSTYENIMSESAWVTSDELSDDQQQTIEDIKRQILTMLREQQAARANLKSQGGSTKRSPTTRSPKTRSPTKTRSQTTRSPKTRSSKNESRKRLSK